MQLSRLDISKEYLDAVCPAVYKSSGLSNVASLADGKDFLIHTPRKRTVLTRACRSDKMKASAVRCITWTTPHGLCFEHTDLVLARFSENGLVELWGPRLAKIPLGMEGLDDRGFKDTGRFYPNFNVQMTPAFLCGRGQFKPGEILADRIKCMCRYTSETGFSRVTLEGALKDVIPYSFFPILEHIKNWGHANINLCAPYRREKLAACVAAAAGGTARVHVSE